MYFRIYASVVAVLLIAYALVASPTSSLKVLARASTLPTTITISVCGDGIASDSEVCDDGVLNNVGGYGSSTAERKCNAGCQSFGPYCGDAILQVLYTEQCDDGNNTSGDLCSSACIPETPAGPPPADDRRGSIPSSGGPVGSILSEIQTRVVLRGKAIPNADLNILVDGEQTAKVRTDSNADFFFTSNSITPGTATIGLWATDAEGAKTITTTVVFEVVQSAVTTVANILIPPTISVSASQVPAGTPLTISGASVPNARVTSEVSGTPVSVFGADVSEAGLWSLQIDTNSLKEGFHTVKPKVELTAAERSGFGRAVSFYIGDEPLSDIVSTDVNDDGRINLVDFSIFLLSWGEADVRFDFNQDGIVSLADFSILLFNWTG